MPDTSAGMEKIGDLDGTVDSRCRGHAIYRKEDRLYLDGRQEISAEDLRALRERGLFKGTLPPAVPEPAVTPARRPSRQRRHIPPVDPGIAIVAAALLLSIGLLAAFVVHAVQSESNTAEAPQQSAESALPPAETPGTLTPRTGDWRGGLAEDTPAGHLGRLLATSRWGQDGVIGPASVDAMYEEGLRSEGSSGRVLAVAGEAFLGRTRMAALAEGGSAALTPGEGPPLAGDLAALDGVLASLAQGTGGTGGFPKSTSGLAWVAPGEAFREDAAAWGTARDVGSRVFLFRGGDEAEGAAGLLAVEIGRDGRVAAIAIER